MKNRGFVESASIDVQISFDALIHLTCIESFRRDFNILANIDTVRQLSALVFEKILIKNLDLANLKISADTFLIALSSQSCFILQCSIYLGLFSLRSR